MRYLRKPATTPLATSGLTYANAGDRKAIRSYLIEDQGGFCAYSERYFEPTDSAHIEHFDPRLKGTDRDGHDNWYAVHAFMNLHKPKGKSIDKFQPMLAPQGMEVAARIRYVEGFFEPVKLGDREAENLIAYLGVNRPEVVEHRRTHVDRIREMMEMLGGDFEKIAAHFQRYRLNLSFATALEVELQLRIADMI